jgi:putative membrane protein
MLNFIVNWLLSAVSLIVVAHIVPGFDIAGFGTAVVAAIAIGFVNGTLGLILKILTFPITIVTLGVFWFVINALMLRLVAHFLTGFTIQGFIPAFLGALVLSIVNLVLRFAVRRLKEREL